VLSDLGVTWTEMAALLWVPGRSFFPGQATKGTFVPVTDVYSYMSPDAAAFTPDQLLEIAAFGTYENLPTGFNKDDLYICNRLANIVTESGYSLVDLDARIANLLRAANISTLQLTVQPNSGGGWAYEIVQYVPTAQAASITTNAQYIAFVETALSTRDPCKGEYEMEPPMVPANAPLLNPAGVSVLEGGGGGGGGGVEGVGGGGGA